MRSRLPSPLRAPLGLLLLLAACRATESDGTGALPMVEGSGFFDRPFPADNRRVDGHPDLEGFPHQGEYPLLDAYLASADLLDGFGTNAPIYVRFTEALDPSLLPTPEGSLAADSPVTLLDVTPGSPTRGEAVPLQFEWTPDATNWKPANLLAFAPIYGFPLRPATTYAVLLRSPLAAPGARPDQLDDPLLADTWATLAGLDLDPEEVSLAWTFTTQDPLAETARIAALIHDDLARPAIEPELTLYSTQPSYTAYVGEVLLPVWQRGERPYHEGGGFEFDAWGVPVLQQWERVHFGLSIPTGEMPVGGWPVVLYSHGTGGDYTSAFSAGSSDEEAAVLGREGVAVFGVSQPLHADRGTPDTNVDLDSFNFYNPEAGRTNFRQGALDQVYLAQLLTHRQPSFTYAGENIRLDPRAVAYFGHSQGGLVGSIAASWMSEDVRAAAFSGAGGGLSITLTLRKDPIDFALVIGSLLQFGDDEPVTELHPVLGLIQTLIEVTDPLNYAPGILAEAPPWSARPLPVLFTEGMEDPYTPATSTEALAAAVRIPIVGEPASDPVALELRGLSPQGLPTSSNVTDWTGQRVSGGLAQFPGQGHFAVYEDRAARTLYRDFLVGALYDDLPVLTE